jgi:hypothetical protein
VALYAGSGSHTQTCLPAGEAEELNGSSAVLLRKITAQKVRDDLCQMPGKTGPANSYLKFKFEVRTVIRNCF